LVTKLRWCDGFICKLRGFTFKRNLTPQDGLVLVEERDGRIGAGIVMVFVFFDLGIFWVNSAGEVVDIKLAKAWRTIHVPKSASRYTVEVHPNVLEAIKVGDHVHFPEMSSE
jgi:uncharacterized membrane protein (UPF0127 family)